MRRWFHMPVATPVGCTRRVTDKVLALTSLLLAAFPGSATADNHRFAIEVRAGAASATAHIAGRALDVGLGIDAQLSLAMTPYSSLYAGFGQRELASDGAENAVLKHEGYAFGIQLHWKTPNAFVGYRLAAGLTYERLEFTDDPELVLKDDRGGGWELAAAVLVPLPGGWNLVPGLRYRSLSSAFDFEDGAMPDDELEFVMLEVGALWSF